MKKTILLLALFCASSFMVSKVFGQTTLEEYNYVTKGYKIQMESGLDMKKGYELESIDKYSTKEREAEIFALYRVKEGKKEISSYMIIYKRSGQATEYICIPSPNSDQEIMDKYWRQLYDGSNDSSQRLQLISFLISKRMKW